MEEQQKKVKNNYRSTEELLRALDQASAEGWQLVKIGSRIHYEWNPSVRYRYQMDYRNVDDLDRYLELFREQGWEQVCAVVSGRYFRKRWDPSLPEEAYEIFTDPESRQQFRRRLSKGALFCCILYALNIVLCGFILLKHYSTSNLCRALCWAFGSAVWGWRVWNTRHPDPARKIGPVWRFMLVLLALALIAGMLWG